jgi:hypothetical protein
VRDALELAAVCEEVEGLWTGLWHPNLTTPLGFPRAQPALRRLLDQILLRQPFVDRLDRIVAWRVARRSVRARRVAPDGRVDCTAAAPWDGQLVLEGETGPAPAPSAWPGEGVA